MGGSVELRSYKLRGRYHLDSLHTALGFHAALKLTNTRELAFRSSTDTFTDVSPHVSTTLSTAPAIWQMLHLSSRSWLCSARLSQNGCSSIARLSCSAALSLSPGL